MEEGSPDKPPLKPAQTSDVDVALEVKAICEAIKTLGPDDPFAKELQQARVKKLGSFGADAELTV